MLQHVGEVEEGRVAGRAVDAGGEPALRQPVEHPPGQVQRQRPLGPEQAEERDRDARGRAARLPGVSAATSRTAKPSRSSCPSRAGSRSGRPPRPKRPPVALEPPQQLEEVHLLGRGEPAQIRLRLPTVIGHGTSSWLRRSLVRVCTKALTAA